MNKLEPLVWKIPILKKPMGIPFEILHSIQPLDRIVNKKQFSKILLFLLSRVFSKDTMALFLLMDRLAQEKLIQCKEVSQSNTLRVSSHDRFHTYSTPLSKPLIQRNT